LSPLLSSVVLDEQDREPKRRGHLFVPYADYVTSARSGDQVFSNLVWETHCGATSPLKGPTNVFFEKAFIYIDVSDAPPFGACTQGKSGVTG